MKRWLIILPLSVLTGIFAYRHSGNSSAQASHLPTAGQPRIAHWFDDAPAAISFTFDDGLQCHGDVAAPMLHELGLRGTFYVVPGLTRQHFSDPRIRAPRGRFDQATLSWDEIRSMHNLGMEIGNHSLIHTFLNKITDDAELNHQINGGADLITQNIGQPPITFAFPYNEFSPHCTQAVLAHHLAVRDIWTDYGGPTFTTEIANGLVEKAIHNHTWLVPMIHGIDGGFLPLSSTVLRQHLAFVKTHANDLWVDTYASVACYNLERNSATLHVQDSIPGELTFFVTGKAPAKPVPLTVVLPLPLNENSDDVQARMASDDTPVPITRESDRVLVNLPLGASVTVTWH